MDNGTVDPENSAVQEALRLLFKAEAGVEYVNDDDVEMPDEDFGYQESLSGEKTTDEILSSLDDIYAITGQTD
jgi:hypothetical protein